LLKINRQLWIEFYLTELVKPNEIRRENDPEDSIFLIWLREYFFENEKISDENRWKREEMNFPKYRFWRAFVLFSEFFLEFIETTKSSDLIFFESKKFEKKNFWIFLVFEEKKFRKEIETEIFHSLRKMLFLD